MSDEHIDAPAPADRATCQRHIEAAKEFPYDGIWKDGELQALRHAEHPAYQVARGILHNFSDRRESNGRGKPCDPACEECCPDFSTGGCGDAVMDGPCFDDLPIAQKGASK